MAKYNKCPNCGKYTVQLCTATVYAFYGDQDDREGNPSEYAGVDITPENVEVELFAHICFNCRHLDDIGIESPQDKTFNTQI